MAIKFQNEGENCGRMVSMVQSNSLILRYELDLILGKIRKNIDVLNLLPSRSIADHDLDRSRLASIAMLGRQVELLWGQRFQLAGNYNRVIDKLPLSSPI